MEMDLKGIKNIAAKEDNTAYNHILAKTILK